MEDIKEGKYLARAIQAQLFISKTGSRSLVARFLLSDSPRNPEPARGKTCDFFGYFTEGSVARTKKTLQACGWSGDWKTFSDIDANEVEIVVEQTEYEGKTRSRVVWVNSVSLDFAGQPMTDQEILQLEMEMAAEFADIIAKNKSAKASRPAKQTAKTYEKPAIVDDEIPF